MSFAGLRTVATSGSPSQLTNDPTARAAKIAFQVVPGLTGKIYVGTPTMNITTLAGVSRILWPNPAGGFSETCEFESHADEDSLYLCQYAIDVQVSGEGALITWWTE